MREIVVHKRTLFSFPSFIVITKTKTIGGNFDSEKKYNVCTKNSS